eukprot:2302918-Alexandrium_andersonii.AAC.1
MSTLQGCWRRRSTIGCEASSRFLVAWCPKSCGGGGGVARNGKSKGRAAQGPRAIETDPGDGELDRAAPAG